MSAATGHAEPDGLATGELVRPLWRRTRFWVALAAVVLLGALLVATVSGGPGRPLDPDSPSQNGSKALARLLTGYGVPVSRETSVDDAVAAGGDRASVLVTSPDDYSADQLRQLAGAGRLVLVQPGRRTLTELADRIVPRPGGGAGRSPGCSDAGMTASGPADWPDDAFPYETGGTAIACYGGVVAITDDLVVLGSADALRNDDLDDEGLAAVGVNAVSDDRTASRVVWLLPGTDAGGSGPASIWDLFPDGAYRVFWWLVAVGVLVALWRARRLGGVVTEPLPVVVRAAELVEGHGRLYLRTGARDRAAWALRQGTLARLATTLGLARGVAPERVVDAAAERTGRPGPVLAALVLGGPPTDDAGLVRIARDLTELETAVTNAVVNTPEGDR